MKLFAFGDSFVHGDQDDLNYSFEQTKNCQDVPYLWEFLRYNVSFSAHIAKALNIELLNYAVPGSGNYPQIDNLTNLLFENKIKSDDIVLFGITTCIRDRLTVFDHNRVQTVKRGPAIISKTLFDNVEKIIKFDLLYVNAILEGLEKYYNVRIIKFNIFDKFHYWHLPSHHDKNFIGYSYTNNTLVDILLDNFGLDNTRYNIADPSNMEIPAQYQKYFTPRRHPSSEGHKKIALWFLENVNWNLNDY